MDSNKLKNWSLVILVVVIFIFFLFTLKEKSSIPESIKNAPVEIKDKLLNIDLKQDCVGKEASPYDSAYKNSVTCNIVWSDNNSPKILRAIRVNLFKLDISKEKIILESKTFNGSKGNISVSFSYPGSDHAKHGVSIDYDIID